MSWSGIANNQCVSDTNLKDALDQGLFTAGATAFPVPTQNKEVTKSRCGSYITIPNPNYPPYAIKSDDQIIVKSDIYAPGDFVLDAQYGKSFQSMTGTGLPLFTYPVTGANTTQSYNNSISSQNIGLSISGTAFVTPVYVALYVNSQIVSTATLSNTGTDSVTLNLPNSIAAPTSIRISINTGTPPSPSSSFSFGSSPVNNVAISKFTGQYQIASIGTWNLSTILSYRFADTGGNLCYSSDYGVTWYKSPTIGTFSKISISDDGQYALAVSQSGPVYRSTNYGATWSEITSLGSAIWGGADLSTLGDTMYVCSRKGLPSGSGRVYKSSNYGASWSDVSPYIPKDYTSVAVNGTGSPDTVIVGTDTLRSRTEALYYLSLDGASSWSDYYINI